MLVASQLPSTAGGIHNSSRIDDHNATVEDDVEEAPMAIAEADETLTREARNRFSHTKALFQQLERIGASASGNAPSSRKAQLQLVDQLPSFYSPRLQRTATVPQKAPAVLPKPSVTAATVTNPASNCGGSRSSGSPGSPLSQVARNFSQLANDLERITTSSRLAANGAAAAPSVFSKQHSTPTMAVDGLSNGVSHHRSIPTNNPQSTSTRPLFTTDSTTITTSPPKQCSNTHSTAPPSANSAAGGAGAGYEPYWRDPCFYKRRITGGTTTSSGVGSGNGNGTLLSDNDADEDDDDDDDEVEDDDGVGDTVERRRRRATNGSRGELSSGGESSGESVPSEPRPTQGNYNNNGFCQKQQQQQKYRQPYMVESTTNNAPTVSAGNDNADDSIPSFSARRQHFESGGGGSASPPAIISDKEARHSASPPHVQRLQSATPVEMLRGLSPERGIDALNRKVSFSTAPIKVFKTHGVEEYDRRNDDIDPMASCAEYELERRLDKMRLFDVELAKGAEGLGVSIIGMGVGADAGLEKLGIFVKSITPGGAVASDGRIRVCDQIVAVDGVSLVGVSQLFAAQTLRATAQRVRFTIGREADNGDAEANAEESEVAQLIRQSLEQDRRRAASQQQNFLLNNTGGLVNNNNNKNEVMALQHGTASEVGSGVRMNGDENQLSSAGGGADADGRLLVGNVAEKMARFSCSAAVAALQVAAVASSPQPATEATERRIRARIDALERELGGQQRQAERMRDVLTNTRTHYTQLQGKYDDARRQLKNYQDREKELREREESHVERLREKDAQYGTLVDQLRYRIDELEARLADMARKRASVVDGELHALRQQLAATANGGIPEEMAEEIVDDGTLLAARVTDDGVAQTRKTLSATPTTRRGNQQGVVAAKEQQNHQQQNTIMIEQQTTQNHQQQNGQQQQTVIKHKQQQQQQQHTAMPQQQYNNQQQNGQKQQQQNTVLNQQQPQQQFLRNQNSNGHGHFECSSNAAATEYDTDSSSVITHAPAPPIHARNGHIQYPNTNASARRPHAGLSQQRVPMTLSAMAPPPSHYYDTTRYGYYGTTGNHYAFGDDVQPYGAAYILAPPIASGGAESPVPRVSEPASPALPPKFGGGGSPSAATACVAAAGPFRGSRILFPLRKHYMHVDNEFWRENVEAQGMEVLQWSTDEVCQLLIHVGLDKYIPEFTVNQVTGPKFLELDGNKLKAMGIYNHADRSIIKKKIKTVKSRIERERKMIERESRQRAHNQHNTNSNHYAVANGNGTLKA